MNLHCKNFCLLVAVTLTLPFCTSVFAQGPADRTIADSATSSSTAVPRFRTRPRRRQTRGPVRCHNTRQEAPAAIGASGSRFTVGFPDCTEPLERSAIMPASMFPSTDVFHTLKGIIPIAVEADKGRFLMPVDFLWMKLGVDNGIPINDLDQTFDQYSSDTVDLTPKVGYRLD